MENNFGYGPIWKTKLAGTATILKMANVGFLYKNESEMKDLNQIYIHDCSRWLKMYSMTDATIM